MANKVILTGRLGQDPDVRYMPSGSAVTTVRLATSEYRRDKESGERKEHTEWHQLVFFNRLAEIAGEYLKKGSRIYVEGSLRTRKWQGKDGQDRYTTEILVKELEMLGGQSAGARADRPSSSSASQEQASAVEPELESEPPRGADFDDDIPFMRLHPLMGG